MTTAARTPRLPPDFAVEVVGGLAVGAEDGAFRLDAFEHTLWVVAAWERFIPLMTAFGETRRVGWDATISVGGVRYSVPHQLVDPAVHARRPGGPRPRRGADQHSWRVRSAALR